MVQESLERMEARWKTHIPGTDFPLDASTAVAVEDQFTEDRSRGTQVRNEARCLIQQLIDVSLRRSN